MAEEIDYNWMLMIWQMINIFLLIFIIILIYKLFKYLKLKIQEMEKTKEKK